MLAQFIPERALISPPTLGINADNAEESILTNTPPAIEKQWPKSMDVRQDSGTPFAGPDTVLRAP